MNSAVSLPVRTAVQGGAAFAIVEFISAFIFDMSERQHAAAVAFLVVLISLIQNVAENGIGRAFLRNPDE